MGHYQGTKFLTLLPGKTPEEAIQHFVSVAHCVQEQFSKKGQTFEMRIGVAVMNTPSASLESLLRAALEACDGESRETRLQTRSKDEITLDISNLGVLDVQGITNKKRQGRKV